MIYRFRDLPLKSKLNVALLLSSSVAILLLFALMLLNAVYNMRQEKVAQLSVLTEVMAANSASALVFNDPKSAADTLAALRIEPEIMFAEIHDRDHQFFASYRNSGVPPGFKQQEASRDSFWDPVFSTSRFIVVDGEPVGHVWIVADLSSKFLAVTEQILALTIATAVSLVVTLLIASYFRRLITKPIEQVASASKAIAHDQDFSRRVPRAGDDEIGQLIDSFNHMVEQIEDRERRLNEELLHRKLTEHELEKLAHYDTLTGLPNRHMFQQALALTLQRAHKLGYQVALLFVDLDNFKVVNDSLGHASGDILLKILSQRLTKCVRTSDIVSRLGGDEFTVIIDQVRGMDHLTEIAEKISAAMAQAVELKDFELQTTASIGIALFPSDATDDENLLRNADTAMYFAKSHGRSNYQFFSPEMNERANKRLIIESHLRHAIERNELFLVYQPQIDLATGRIVGAEALLRWLSPELGAVGPDQFIPVAEETGLIQQIGDFVMESACRQAKRWRDEDGVPLRIAVNVSIRQFSSKLFVHNVQSLLEHIGLPVDLLELEIIESCIMDNVEDTLIKIRKLRELGIRLSIDDFGTGYSSMTYLKQLPISQLKVDQSFVRGIPESNEDMEIVRAVIHLAHGLRLESLAEGVETEAQASFLRGEGCMIGQGYYFSRPVPTEEMTKLLKENRIYGPY
jgi:diguanylate cyclase (GGDEF)-like protein